MEKPEDKKGPKRVTAFLKVLSCVQVICSVTLLTLILVIDNTGILEMAAEEIMMPGRAIWSVAVILLLLLTTSGVVAFLKVRYGWVFSFLTAMLVLLMTILLGPGTITLTVMSFVIMTALSLVAWAQAIVYYFWDLYT